MAANSGGRRFVGRARVVARALARRVPTLGRRKSPRVKRMFDRMFPLDPSQEKNIKRLLPYGLD